MKIKTCPSYGNNNPEADAFAAGLTNTLIDMLEEDRPWHGGRFLASSIQFATYVGAGNGYGATPDGREANGPLCDSLAAIHGNDKNGCLDMLTSIAKLPLNRMLGTPVVNLKLAKSHVDGNLRSLARAFFKMGGMQLQINCRSREELIEADKDPDAYPGLCVRIGGYSEYFKNLSHEYRQTVIDRTEF